jgi:hypothetical protein
MCGVYIMWFGPIALYIGESIDVGRRLDEHAESRMVALFTHWSAIQTEPDERKPLEGRLTDLLPWCEWLGFNRRAGG